MIRWIFSSLSVGGSVLVGGLALLRQDGSSVNASSSTIGTRLLCASPTPTNTGTPTNTPTPTPTPTPGGFDPRTIGYWKNHPDVATQYLPSTAGNTTITQAWQVGYYLSTDGYDMSKLLSAQLLAAKLNVAAGHKTPAYPGPAAGDLDRQDFSGRVLSTGPG